MNKNEQDSDDVIDFLINYLILSLDELTDTRTWHDFDEGAITAFVECLEVLSRWKDFSKFGINDIESIYPVK